RMTAGWRGLTKADRAGVKPSRDQPTPQAARRRAFQRQFSGFCPRRTGVSMIWNRVKGPYCGKKLGRLTNGPTAQWRHGDARGLEVSPGGLLQNELVQHQIGNRLAQPAVLQLKVLQALHLLGL